MSRELYFAACSFGTEATVAHELDALHIERARTVDTRVYFYADEAELARANIWLRCADRIYRVLSEFEATTFDMLFEGVRAIPFGDFIPQRASIPVSADAVRSQLGSVRDVQAVAKKAVVTAMQRVYSPPFPETGKPFRIYISILKDHVTVALNTSGAGLARRGYRTLNATAPLKESLAAALLHISRWKYHPLCDPMCGSGTIAVEAAMMAMNMAPGMRRHFDALHFGGAYKSAFDRERERARCAVTQPCAPVFASDADESMVELTRFHAQQAGVDGAIKVEKRAVAQFRAAEGMVVITNPPYAQRLGERKETDALYAQMGRSFPPGAGVRVFVVCADEAFEKKFGARADKKRKLYNGGMKVTFYQYFRG